MPPWYALLSCGKRGGVMKARKAVVLATAVAIVLATAATATARPRGPAPAVRGAAANFVQTLRASALHGPTTAAVTRAAKAGASPAAVEATTFPGFGWCQDPRLTAWAAYDPAHQATLTRSYWVTSTTGDFTDAVVTESPWYWLGTDLNHFYKLNASFVQVGPTVSYARATVAWQPNSRPEYDLVVNAIWYLDGGMLTSAGTATAEMTGPNAIPSSPVCYFPPIP